MQAGMLACPECGAACPRDAVRCAFCHVQLQTVSCAGCLSANFVGARHCSHCGAALFASSPPAAGAHPCPHCQVELSVMAIGDAILEECGRCGGVWVDAQSFERLSSNRAEQAAWVGLGSPSAIAAHPVDGGAIKYVPCPDCKKLMQRVNFARCSGVIVDVCRGHGIWFDRDELRQILVFIQQGGLDLARKREHDQLELERARLKEQKRALRGDLPPAESARDYAPAFSAAGELLKFLLS